MMRWTMALGLLLAACGKPADNGNDGVTADPPATSSAAPAAPASPPARETSRDAGVLAALAPIVGDMDPKARAAIGYADIGGDHREEALVYLVDPMRCGTGGCSLIVLTPSGKGWRSVAETSVTQLPVHRLLTKKDGWNDLAVGIGGGGGKAGTALLRFDRNRYPSNPSVQPILNRLPEGAREILPDDYDHLTPVG